MRTVTVVIIIVSILINFAYIILSTNAVINPATGARSCLLLSTNLREFFVNIACIEPFDRTNMLCFSRLDLFPSARDVDGFAADLFGCVWCFDDQKYSNGETSCESTRTADDPCSSFPNRYCWCLSLALLYSLNVSLCRRK